MCTAEAPTTAQGDAPQPFCPVAQILHNVRRKRRRRERMRRAVVIALFVAAVLVSGCYTTAPRKRLTKREWLKNHRYQFFHDTKWGREWNYYYWSPYIPRGRKHGRGRGEKKLSGPSKRFPRGRYDEACECISSCLDGLDIVNIFIIDEDEGSSEPDTTSRERGERRRGM